LAIFDFDFFLLRNPKIRDKLLRNIYNFWFHRRRKTVGGFSFRRIETVFNPIADDPPGLLSQIS